MKRLLLLAALLLFSTSALATSSDVVLTTPATSSATVTKICIASAAIDAEHHSISAIYKPCTSPGVFISQDVTTLNITDSGYVLQPPLGAASTSGTTPNWASVAPTIAGAPLIFKNLLISVLPGS